MQLSALQIFYFALALLSVAILALIRGAFKKRQSEPEAATTLDLAARLEPLPTPPANPPPPKIQRIDGQFSKRRSASTTWPEGNSLSIVHAGPRLTAPVATRSAPVPVTAPAPAQASALATALAPIAPPAPETQKSTSTALILPPVTVDALLWERLLATPTQAELRAVTSRRLAPAPAPSVDTLFELVHRPAQLEAPAEPEKSKEQTGMIDEPALKDLLARTKTFTGLVVSIGLNEPDDGVWRGEGLYQSITNFVGSVLGKNDLGCRTAMDEFLVISPGQQGSDAQNHLNNIADRLWDFQLRGIGACAILFSWGVATVDSQSLANAITSATQRMRQAKQRRNPLPARSLGTYNRSY